GLLLVIRGRSGEHGGGEDQRGREGEQARHGGLYYQEGRPRLPAWAEAVEGERSDSPLCSRLPQQDVHTPAPPDVFARTPQVIQDVFILAPGVHQRVRQDGGGAEVPAVVHLLSEGDGDGGQ